MPLTTGPYVTEKVGDRCAWIANADISNFRSLYCGAPSAYVMSSSVNGSLFYACKEHMAAERLCSPKSIARIQTHRSNPVR